MPSRLRESRCGNESSGPKSFFITSQETPGRESEVGNRQIVENDEIEEVVQHLLSGEVALIASGAWSLAAQIKGRIHPSLRIVALQPASRRRKSILVPLRGGIIERRKEILGQLEF